MCIENSAYNIRKTKRPLNESSSEAKNTAKQILNPDLWWVEAVVSCDYEQILIDWWFAKDELECIEEILADCDRGGFQVESFWYDGFPDVQFEWEEKFAWCKFF